MLASTMFALFVASFFALMEELLYTASVLLGFGNAVLWIAQVRNGTNAYDGGDELDDNSFPRGPCWR